MDAYEHLFGEKPMGCSSPLEKGDHPELDMSPKLNEEGRAFYICHWLDKASGLFR